ncbi:MAG: hypothetical protein KAT70_05250 [Thermoplasmata archaeon]|nr:hypothetical protein [Thermoplasmata archaeon]
MSNMLTLIQTWGDTVADHAAAKTWSQANYNRDHQVFVGGIDERDPPEESEYPLVVVRPETKRVGWDVTEKGHRVEVVTGIFKEGYTATGKANAVELTGHIYNETFRKHIEDAIVGIYTEGTDLLRIVNAEFDYMNVEIYPFFLVGMLFTIEEDEFQGTDVWE